MPRDLSFSSLSFIISALISFAVENVMSILLFAVIYVETINIYENKIKENKELGKELPFSNIIMILTKKIYIPLF